MPTPRGWIVAAAGLLLTVAGRLLAAPEVERLGLAGPTLVVIAVVVVRRGRADLDVVRTVAPERVAGGGAVSVALQIDNRGRGAAPLLLIEDRLPRGVTGRARFVLQGIEPGGHRDAGYELSASRRGRYRVGPLQMAFLDPFALARVRAPAAGTSDFLVRPRIEPLTLPRDRGAAHSSASAGLRHPAGVAGEDFFTLREYAEGEDLRKVHWPSTAKRGRFTIRQEETPWHTRATILIDDRAAAHVHEVDRSSFERAIEITASLCDLYHRSGYSFRVVGAREPGGPARKGVEHLNRSLDWLATLEPATDVDGPDPLLTRLVELERGSSRESVLVVVTGTLDAATAIALGGCRRRFKDVVAVSLPAHLYGRYSTKARWIGERQAVESARLLARAGGRAVAVGPTDPFAPRWAPARMLPEGGDARWDLKPALV